MKLFGPLGILCAVILVAWWMYGIRVATPAVCHDADGRPFKVGETLERDGHLYFCGDPQSQWLSIWTQKIDANVELVRPK